MVQRQDKSAEIATGRYVPDLRWLERNAALDQINKKRLQLVGVLPVRGLRVLDAGCGPGNFGLLMAREGADVYSVDIATEAVAITSARAHRDGLALSPAVADVERLPFPDNAFDVCFCGWVLHHFPDLSASVAELRRVLKPGGKLALIEPNESSPVMRISRFAENLPVLRNMVLKAGWDTPNRTVHRHDAYLQALEKACLKDIRFSTYTSANVEHPSVTGGPLKRWVLIALFGLRALFFAVTARISHSRLAGVELMLTSTK